MTLEKFLATLTEAQKIRLAEFDLTPEEFVNEYNIHNANSSDAPAVYCGTYGKYNDGDLTGQWIDLTTFSDFYEFKDYCYALHSDEADPELMFQDYENFPREWYDEWIGEDEFNKIQQYIELCDKYDKEAIDAFVYVRSGDALDDFEDAYMGKWDDEEDFATHIVDECHDLRRMMGNLASYFDYKAFARDLFDYDYEFEDGYVFRR